MKITYRVTCRFCGYERSVEDKATARDLRDRHVDASDGCREAAIKAEYEGKREV